MNIFSKFERKAKRDQSVYQIKTNLSDKKALLTVGEAHAKEATDLTTFYPSIVDGSKFQWLAPDTLHKF